MPPLKSGGMITYQRENQRGFALLLSPLLLLNPLVNLFSVNTHIFGCIDAQANLIALDSQHGHTDVITNDECLADSTGKN